MIVAPLAFLLDSPLMACLRSDAVCKPEPDSVIALSCTNGCSPACHEPRLRRPTEILQQTSIAIEKHGDQRVVTPQCPLLNHQCPFIAELGLIHEPSLMRQQSPIPKNCPGKRRIRT